MTAANKEAIGAPSESTRILNDTGNDMHCLMGVRNFPVGACGAATRLFLLSAHSLVSLENFPQRFAHRARWRLDAEI